MHFAFALGLSDKRFVKCRFARSRICTFRFVCFQDVLNTSSRHVLKSSSRYVFKTSSRHVFKTSSRRLEDQQIFAGILPNFIIFFQCVNASPNRIGGFCVRDERRTLIALSTFSTLSVFLSLLSGCGFSAFIPAELLLAISKWSSESLMCLYFLTIEMFLVNTFPSLFLLTMIVGPFTLVTVNKSFVQ